MMLRRCGLVLALTALVSLAGAQTGGALRGTVLDSGGSRLAGVTISVRSAAAAVENRVAMTGADGRFSITGLPAAGDYTLRASLDGYATVVLSDVAIEAGQVTTVALQLTPAANVQERTQVRATGPVVALDEQGQTARYASEYLDALPLLGRNYQDVLTLSAGVTDVDGDGNPNIHGARETDVGTLVDGINTTDPLTGTIGMQLNIESVQEIEVKTSGANAEFGRAQGGFVNVLTKSGGNDFQGTFKFYWRGSALDGDGAGQDDPRLHGGVGEIGLRDLRFNDYLPFLSVSGPLVKDHAWYFAAVESIRREDPVNALSQAFVATTRELRAFAKATWQAAPNHRLVLVYNSDPVERLNQGLNSLTREETGYTVQSGGPMLTARGTAVLSPTVALETVASYMRSGPEVLPNLGPDTNGNGILYDDRNSDGFFEAREGDPGQDFDGDGAFDVWEDTMFQNGLLDQQERLFCHDELNFFRPVGNSGTCIDNPVSILTDEDGIREPPGVWPIYHAVAGDGDRRLTPPGGCEGTSREDIDCDGHLDRHNEDDNGNGQLDHGEDLDSDGHLDLGIEDRNHNLQLDDAPFPTSLYPYGSLRPTPADRAYTIDLRSGLVSGPYFESYEDDRTRATLRQDLSVFVPEFRGSHDLKMGYLLEREQFHRDSSLSPVVALDDPGYHTGVLLDQLTHPEIHYDCNPYLERCRDPRAGRITAILPIEPSPEEEATGWNVGSYIQDTYKPVPNLSLGLGVRFDHETIASSGYTHFDPQSEGLRSGRLRALAGGEIGRDDVVSGNGDGVQSVGILADPLFLGSPAAASIGSSLIDDLRRKSLQVLFQPRSALLFGSPTLAKLYPEIFTDGTINLDALQALGIPVQQTEGFTIVNSNLAPRLSVSWDPAGTGRTKLFGTWGRYYDRLFLSTVTGEQGLQTAQRYYVYDRYGVDVVPGLGSSIVPRAVTPDHGYGALLSSAPPSVTQVSRNLSTPFCDELTAGFEREIAPEVALSVRYVRRQYRDQIQDIDVNHEVRIDPVTGDLSDRFGVLTEITSPVDQSPIAVRLPDGRPDLFVRNVFFNQVLEVGNFNEAFYHGLELELWRRLSRRWQMNGSYTYSRAMGQAEDFQSRLGNDPSTLESEFGYLDYDQRHVLKLHASVYLPADWQLGVASVWGSGLPYSVVSRFFAHDNVDYQQFRTRYGYTVVNDTGPQFVTQARNSERNNAYLNLDLSARRNFVVGRTSWAMMFEVFNALNSDDLIISSVEPSQVHGFDTGSLSVLASPTQIDATRRFGRRFQVGFQVQF